MPVEAITLGAHSRSLDAFVAQDARDGFPRERDGGIAAKALAFVSAATQLTCDEKRSFSRDHELASDAGRKGGQTSGGNFANDRERAAEAGRRGGESSHGKR
jgi:general stress protein YciG